MHGRRPSAVLTQRYVCILCRAVWVIKLNGGVCTFCERESDERSRLAAYFHP